MSIKYKFRNPEGIYFVSFAVVNWLDVFTRNIYREILCESFSFCQVKKGLNIYAYVIMPNHVHMIMSRTGEIQPESIMRDLKKFTSNEIIHSIINNPRESRKEWMLKMFEEEGKNNSNNTKYQFWQQDNHPIELVTNEMQNQRLNYVHNNPVEAGFVHRPEDYPWSSAQDYAGINGPVKVLLLN